VVYVDIVKLDDGKKKIEEKNWARWSAMREGKLNEMGCDYFVELKKGYNNDKRREGGYGIYNKGNEVIWFCLKMCVMSNVCQG
jgi:hypothetical protein